MRLIVTDPGTPISLAGALATQSSGYQGGDPFPASNAIDGNLNNFTHTALGDPAPTWTLTLPSETQVGGTFLYNRTDCCGERLRNITVRVFSDAAGTVPVFTSAVLNPNNVLNSPATLSVSPGNATGRVIRVSRGPSTPAGRQWHPLPRRSAAHQPLSRVSASAAGDGQPRLP
jgi:hypothetical protein